MSQIGRSAKHLEAPRPLKSAARPIHHNSTDEIKSIDELINLTEKMAIALSSGITNTDSLNILLANLRIYGPELEVYYKDALDRAFVAFRNASQDERLSIISRMNLLELIELRAKSWQVSDGINTYYKHKATDVQPDNSGIVIDLTLGTSPPSSAPTAQILNPGELIRTSGKFPKPTKIPGKNYSKDEVVIRNADSGKVMGIKGRRVHMIEELSETIISFQRVNPGAKERLVQITGPNEEKINYAKQLIEGTIRRNASPVRLEANQGGSCSSLASSTSDETVPRANRNSALMSSGSGNISNTLVGNNNLNNNIGGGMMLNQFNQHVPINHSTPIQTNMMAGGGGGGGNAIIGHHNNNNIATNVAGLNKSVSGQQRQLGGHNMLLHSLSTNDASLGEYKYTVNVGQHNLKITGDCFELVRIAKLVLDDYFSSNEFLASVEAGQSMDSAIGHASSSVPSTPVSGSIGGFQLNTSSPFADSGIGLNMMANTSLNVGKMSINSNVNNNCVEVDDDVFIVENDTTESTSSSNSTTIASTSSTTPSVVAPNGLTRSRRSHFSLKDTTPESNRTSNSESGIRIVHKYERLLYFAKSPHSWALPHNWTHICDNFPNIIRNKDFDDQKNRFDADKYLQQVKSSKYAKFPTAAMNDEIESPDRELRQP